MLTLQLMSGKVFQFEFQEGKKNIGNLLMKSLLILQGEGIRWHTLFRVCLLDRNGNECGSWWPAGNHQNGLGDNNLLEDGETTYYIFSEENRTEE